MRALDEPDPLPPTTLRRELGLGRSYALEWGGGRFSFRWTHRLTDGARSSGWGCGLPLLAAPFLWLATELPRELAGPVDLSHPADMNSPIWIGSLILCLAAGVVGAIMIWATLRSDREVVLELEERGPLRLTRIGFVGSPTIREVDRTLVLDLRVHHEPLPGMKIPPVLLAVMEDRGLSRELGPVNSYLKWENEPRPDFLPEDCGAVILFVLPDRLPPRLREDLQRARGSLRALLGAA